MQTKMDVWHQTVILLLGWLVMIGGAVDESLEELAKDNAKFAFEMYKELDKQVPDANLFFSPVSISAAMGMLYAGANGDTKEEIGDKMNFDEHGNVHALFKGLLKIFNEQSNNYTLKIANRLFASNRYTFLDNYIDDTKNYYSAAMDVVDFAKTEKTVNHINDFVANSTDDKILNFLSSSDINSLTVLVLINAIYFSGSWMYPFERSDTTIDPFYLGDGTEINMPMMHKDDYFFYGEIKELDCKVLELKYTGEMRQAEVSMYILLPNKKDGLGFLEEKINVDDLFKEMNKMQRTKVVISIPKFNMTQSIDLGATFRAMGMNDMFEKYEADLSGIGGSKDLFVDKVFHKAFVDINEEGTEAAGATGISIMLTSIMDPFTFEANHPFMFFISESRTKSILFLGRLGQSPSDDNSIVAISRPLSGAESIGCVGLCFPILTLLWLSVL